MLSPAQRWKLDSIENNLYEVCALAQSGKWLLSSAITAHPHILATANNTEAAEAGAFEICSQFAVHVTQCTSSGAWGEFAILLSNNQFHQNLCAFQATNQSESNAASHRASRAEMEINNLPYKINWL